MAAPLARKRAARAAERQEEQDTTWQGRLWRHRGAVGLGLVLALAAALRLSGLGRESLWWDEAYSISWSLHGYGWILELMVNRDYHPPEYYFLLHAWMGAFGSGPEAARALSAVLGLAGVAFVYLLGRDLFNVRTGVIGALLVAVSSFHLYYSQEARSYALLFAAAAAATHAYWLLFHTEGRRGAKLAYYLAATTLVLYAHFTGVFVVAAHFLHRAVLLARSRDLAALRLWLLTQAGVALLYLPWALVLLEQAGRLQGNFWIPEPTVPVGGRPYDFSIIGTFHQFVGGPALRGFLLWLAIGNAVVASTLGGLNRERTADDRPGAGRRSAAPKLWLLGAWLLCSMLLPFVQSLVSQPIYMSRVIIPALAPFLLLAAVGLGRLRSASVQAVAVAAVVLFAGPTLADYYGVDAKERWDRAIGAVGEQADPGASVVLAEHTFVLVDDYTDRDDLKTVALGDGPTTADRTRGATDVWLIGRQGPVCDRPSDVTAALAQGRTVASCEVYMPTGWREFPLAANPLFVWRFTGCEGPCAGNATA
jgi:mannosyltransferase